MSQDRQAMLYGMTAVALWSTVATAFKLALASMTPLHLIWIATLVSWLMLCVVVVQQGLWSAAMRGRWGRALWAGLMNPVIYYLLLFSAYDRLPGQEAMALNYTWALSIAFLAVPVLGQRLTRTDVLAGLVAYAGVWVIATRGSVFSVEFADAWGVALALASTLFWAMYWLLSVRDDRQPVVAQWQNFSIALPVLTLLVVLGPGFSASAWVGLGAAVYVGLFEMGVAFLLWQKAMRGVSRTAKIANLIFLSPPLSLLFLYWIIHEPIQSSTLVGLALILSGLAIQQFLGVKSSNI